MWAKLRVLWIIGAEMNAEHLCVVAYDMAYFLKVSKSHQMASDILLNIDLGGLSPVCQLDHRDKSQRRLN